MLRLNELKPLFDRGCSLIYLHERDKRPIGKRWTEKPTLTWQELKDKFQPERNIGVRLGKPSKIGKHYLACIDVDVKDPAYKDEALKKLSELTCGVSFPRVSSGGGNGSRHLYCVTKKPFDQITIAKHKGKWEIVIYSTGRQMVLPPSIHPSGREYKWAGPSIADGVPLFNTEKWEKQAEKQSKERELDFEAVEVDLYSSSLPMQFIQMVEGKKVSDRSAALFSVTLAMCRHGFSDNEILSVLSDPDNWISGAAYEHTQSASRARAVRWLHKYTLEKARYETSIARRFENRPVREKELSEKQAKKIEAEIAEERSEVFPDLDTHGKPKCSQRNVIYALKHRLGGKVVGLNEFNNRSSFLMDTDYGGVKGQELSDHDDMALKRYCSEHFRFEPSKEICYEAHSLIAKDHSHHPVRDYLDKLEWDGEERLDGWLKRAFGARGPRKYVEAVARKVLVAAVARIYEPGCKFDHVMILEGDQGKGKSTAIRMLAGDKWFTDGIGDIFSKDAVDQMCGKWLIEFGELASFKRTDKESLKSFISRQTDRVRMPYGRRSMDYPRQSIFIGTTNSEEYLTDESGNRRYWPIKIEQADFMWLKRNRDQLWAEAKTRYELGEDLFFNEEIEALARQQQAKRMETDEWQTDVAKFLEENDERTKFTTREIYEVINNQAGQAPDDHQSKRIGKIMRLLGYQRTSFREGGVVTKGWRKKC